MATASNSSCVLYLGAIPYNWDVEIIKSVVCGSGPVVDVRCMMDNASKNKGFCFVEYSTPDSAARALHTLSKVKIEGRKKLRIELSKEGLRNPTPGQKPELQLNRNFLPSNVILPQEMLISNPTLPPQYNTYQSGQTASSSATSTSTNVNSSIGDNQFGGNNRFPPISNTNDLMSTISSNPQLSQMVSQMISSGMDLNQITANIQQFTRQQQQQGQGQGQFSSSIHSSIPTNLSMASQYLPLPQQSHQKLYAKDKVSETLASIPPGILIELLAKLKMILTGPTPNYSEAAKLLHENPKLAVAAAQSLLLMGIIDLDVINQSMNTQQPSQFMLSQQQQQPQQSTQQFSPFSASELMHQPSPSPTSVAAPNNSNSPPSASTPSNISIIANENTSTNANITSNPSFGPQPLQQVQQQQLQQALINQMPPQKQLNPDWLGFSQSTISKLLTINEQEASLIVQVLKLSPQQIEILPDNERLMASQIRAQYL